MTQADWLAGGAPAATDKVAAQMAVTYIACEAAPCYRGDADGRLPWSPSPDSAASSGSGSLTPQHSLSSPPALLAPVAPQARLVTLGNVSNPSQEHLTS